MPLRDHFHPPLSKLRHFESFHAGWPVMIVAALRKKLPRRYFAEVRVHSGKSAEIDVVTYEKDDDALLSTGNGSDNGGVAVAVWAPPQPVHTLATDLAALPVFEVRVYDEVHQARLVAAVEIVSPANKDRLEHRQAFVAKCAALLQERVSVVLVDVVTARGHNLYAELLQLLGHPNTGKFVESAIYAAACRMTKRANEWQMEGWTQPLTVGEPLPTLPLWLADNLAVPLELEASYEQSCEILGIP